MTHADRVAETPQLFSRSVAGWKRGPDLHTGFVVANYLLAELGLAGLALSEILPALFHLLAQILLAACFLLEMKNDLPRRPPTRFSLSLWGLPALPLLYFVFHLPLLETVTAFLTVLLLSRFVFKTELNDYLYGHLIAVVCLLIGAIFIHGLEFGAVFLAFYLTLSFCLIFYNMLVERVGSQSPPDQFRRAGVGEYPGPALFGMASALVLSSLVLTALIFVCFPRFGLGFLALHSNLAPISGFTDIVRLGDVGKIKMNPEVVLRVEFKKDGKPYRPPGNLYWRGVALNHYDGKAWTSTAPTAWRTANRPGTGLPLFTVNPPVRVVQQDIFLEAFDSDYVFTSGIPLFLDGNFRNLAMDQNFSLQALDGQVGARRYTLVSELGYPHLSYDRAAPGDSTPHFLDRFLQLPTIGEDVRRLAETATQNATDPPAKAEAILRFLARGYTYSLDMGKDTERPGLDEFLLTRKKGHCEYFASAMVILLRLAGVPARLVNGFIGAEWNDMGNYMIVRQNHAHSWVEAYIPETGWRVYDPTPAGPGLFPLPATDPVTRSLDYLRLLWQRYIVRYSLQDQVSLVQWFNLGGLNLAFEFKRLSTRRDYAALAQQYRLWIWLGGASLALWLYRRSGGVAFSRRPPVPPPVRLYTRMLEALAKRGLRKQPQWTPREFLARLDRAPAPLQPEARSLVAHITELYEQCRFAGSPGDPQQSRQLQSRLKQL
jgi:transglutaminase-like putative cysteine protease